MVRRPVAKKRVAKKRVAKSPVAKVRGAKPSAKGTAREAAKRKDPHPQPLPTRGRGGDGLAVKVKPPPKKTAKPVVKHIITVKRFGRRAPSPMNFTDNLLADARRRYETTLEPITWIANDLEVCRTTLRSFAERNGWVRFNAPPLDISPAARLAQQTEAFVRASSPAGTPPDDGVPLAGADEDGSGDAAGDMSLDGPAGIDWLRRELRAQIRIVKALRTQQRAEPLTVEDGLKLGRMLVQLTDTFLKLNRHTQGAAPEAGDDLPENIDEFRNELARRIRAFVASRTGTGDADGADAVPSMDKAGR